VKIPQIGASGVPSSHRLGHGLSLGEDQRLASGQHRRELAEKLGIEGTRLPLGLAVEVGLVQVVVMLDHA